MTVLDNPIVTGLGVGIPSFLLGVLGYRRSQAQDRRQASSEAVGQIISGLNVLVDSLQSDRDYLRQQIAVLEGKLEQALAIIETKK